MKPWCRLPGTNVPSAWPMNYSGVREGRRLGARENCRNSLPRVRVRSCGGVQGRSWVANMRSARNRAPGVFSLDGPGLCQGGEGCAAEVGRGQGRDGDGEVGWGFRGNGRAGATGHFQPEAAVVPGTDIIEDIEDDRAVSGVGTAGQGVRHVDDAKPHAVAGHPLEAAGVGENPGKRIVDGPLESFHRVHQVGVEAEAPESGDGAGGCAHQLVDGDGAVGGAVGGVPVNPAVLLVDDVEQAAASSLVVLGEAGVLPPLAESGRGEHPGASRRRTW